MNESKDTGVSADQSDIGAVDQPQRRGFLGLFALLLGAGMVGTVAATALRFLRPTAKFAQDVRWLNLLPVAELNNKEVVTHSVAVTQTVGWSSEVSERFVFILPDGKNSVLSAVCPHEGCNVIWQESAQHFQCPCHDSSFSSAGERLGGPAPRGLDPLPTRVQDGVLQVQYQTFVNNSKTRELRS